MSNSDKLVFPKIRKVKLDRFSLYTLKPQIELEIPAGVFCLAGANGLGKSTFLSAVNFGLTGIVPNPDREFKSVEEYFKYGAGYSREFFTGRILEEDRDVASVCIELLVGDNFYQFQKGIFDKDELRELKIESLSTKAILFQSTEMTASQRWTEYQKRITADIGLASFEQFVFLQHFIFTFDESRHLVLWDPKVLTQALYLCIGADFKKAQEADKIRREMEKAASLARNFSYQASNVRNRIEILRDAMKSPKDDQSLDVLRGQYQVLKEELASKVAEVERKRAQLSDTDLQWMELSSRMSTLQTEYIREFSCHTHKDSYVRVHPLVTSSLSDLRCAVCGAEGQAVADHVQKEIESQRCPFCSTKILNRPPSTESTERLISIDAQISETKQQLRLVLQTKERIISELKTVESQFSSAQAVLKGFEDSNETYLLQLDKTDILQSSLKKLHEEMTELISRKNKKYEERDEKNKQYIKLQRELEHRYAEAETVFVPLFRNLAFLFLGIHIDIRIYSRDSVVDPGLSLILEMRGTIRREEYQLSESQRFFLDIALRMAFAQYMSASTGKASLFIDTPEGSLDIAYESRAGQMFAQFVKTEHSIIMTANINSSQLLKRLASECRGSCMKLHKMTSWTELSDVQLQEEALFQHAYEDIENALNSGI
ncbi:MAG: AAA family ATPase [Syntrophobacteraceae bacterium]